jgi:hypothetical protein
MKTAGTSIEVFLSQCCGENDIVTPIQPHVAPHWARNWKGIWNPFPELIENRRRGLKSTSLLNLILKQNKFYNHIPATSIRARISKTVWDSYFKFCVERNPWDKTLSHYHMFNVRAGGGITLDDYIAKGSFCINHPKYTDSDGAILVDKIIKYESLTEELTDIFDKLNIPFEGTLGVRAKSDFRTDRRPCQEIFTNHQKGIIEKVFAKEIKIHDYVF